MIFMIDVLVQWRAADSGDEKETDERENHGPKRTNQPTVEQVF